MRCGGPNFNGVASHLCRKFENRPSNYFYFSPPVEAMANCMEMDILYSGKNIERIYNIHSWESCAMLCEKDSRCFAWSLFKSGICYLKDKNWKIGKRDLKGVISGTKNCIGSTRTTTTASAKTTTLETTTATTTTTAATTTTPPPPPPPGKVYFSAAAK